MYHKYEGLFPSTGQFQYRSAQLLPPEGPPFESDMRVARLGVQGRTGQRLVDVMLIKQTDMESGGHIPCWFLRNDGRGLVDARHTDYIVPKLTCMHFALAQHVRL